MSGRELDDEAMGTGGDSHAGAELAGVVDLNFGMLGPGNVAKLGWGSAREFCRRSLFLCALMLAFVWQSQEGAQARHGHFSCKRSVRKRKKYGPCK